MIKHVGIIMDGNRRWAKDLGKPSSFGHKKGAENLINLSKAIFERGVKVLSVFAFSTENFKRSEDEVSHLMNLFISYAKTHLKTLQEEDIKIVFSGRKDGLSKNVLKALTLLENEKSEAGHILNICFNYGGRDEIIRSAFRLAEEINENSIKLIDIDEDQYKKYLDQYLPDMDILIRTGGESRISNFMLYYLSYAELFFTKTYFPAFNIDEYIKIENEFNTRNRRFGK